MVPSGWLVTFGNGVTYTSNGTPHDISAGYTTTGGNEIRATPAPDKGGTLSVQAIDNTCGGQNNATSTVNSISLTQAVNVTRPTPTLTTVSDKSPNGGNFSLLCGDQSDYHFRVVTGSIPSGGLSATWPSRLAPRW